MSFDLDGYVDVAERIRIFREKHPDGSLQSEVTIDYDNGRPVGVLCKAYAYRGPDDERPGLGHSYLAIPGKTPYTKDSEIENAETSAWGRAIVAALIADTKKIASAQEVKKVSAGADGESSRGTGAPASPSSAGAPDKQSSFVPPAGATLGGDWKWPFGKHKGKSLDETPRDYLEWFAENGKAEDVKERVNVYLLGGELEAVGATQSSFYDQSGNDDDIPF